MTVILRVQTVLTGWQGAPGLSTIYWRPGTGGGTTADATDCAARVRAFWVSIGSYLTSTFHSQTSSQVDAIEDSTGALTGSFAATTPASTTGTGSINYAAIPAMALIRLRTNLIVGPRILKGRLFIGPLDEGAVNGFGDPTTNCITDMNSGALGMVTGGATASFPVVWHRPRVGSVGTSGPIVSVSTWGRLGTLRSRRD
jgi:hypothetical protein